jgi:hypothetical protein
MLVFCCIPGDGPRRAGDRGEQRRTEGDGRLRGDWIPLQPGTVVCLNVPGCAVRSAVVARRVTSDRTKDVPCLYASSTFTISIALLGCVGVRRRDDEAHCEGRADYDERGREEASAGTVISPILYERDRSVAD